MNGLMPIDFTSKINYLEKNLEFLKRETIRLTKDAEEKFGKLYRCLPRIKISFPELKSVRKTLSSGWEKKWS